MKSESFLVILLFGHTLLLIGYTIFYSWVTKFWVKFRSSENEHNITLSQDKLFVSVVIAIRNEALNLPALLHCLDQQLSKYQFEVIFVDDHSTDNSIDIVSEFAPDAHIDLKLISQKRGDFGKKMALDLGIRQSRGEIIITTDGDCMMGEHWIQSIASKFLNKKVMMLVSPVMLTHTRCVLPSISAFEFHALQVLTCFYVSRGKAILCNGANLAFRKSAYQSVGGYKGYLHIPSGDDVFLMHKVGRDFAGSIRYNKHIHSTVRSRSLTGFKEILNQKIRWAGKWSKTEGIVLPVLAIFTYLSHLMMLLVTIVSVIVFDKTYIILVLISWSLKILVDFRLLKVFHAFHGEKIERLLFIKSAVLYPIYVMLLGGFSLLGVYEWKNRRYK